jgi:hypothetical protein
MRGLALFYEARMNIFVFVSADAEMFGFSLLGDGSNLPPTAGGKWTPHATIRWSARDINRYTSETELAMMNLRTRGYYLLKRSATVLRFPQPHRLSGWVSYPNTLSQPPDPLVTDVTMATDVIG